MGDAGNAGGAEGKRGVKFGSATARTFKYMGKPSNIRSKGKTLRKRDLDEVFKPSKVPYTRQELKYLLGLLKLHGDEEVQAYFNMKRENLRRFPQIENISSESMDELIKKGHKKIFRDTDGKLVSLFDLVKEEIQREKAKKNPMRSLARGESMPVKMLYTRNKTHKVARQKDYMKDLVKLAKLQIQNSNSSATKRRKTEELAKLEANMAERHTRDQALAHLYAKQNVVNRNTRRNYVLAKLLYDEEYWRPQMAQKRAQATRKARSASPRGKFRD